MEVQEEIINVLIVEDELLLAYSIKKMLEPKYNICDMVISYNEAMKVLETQQIDIILIDVTLTGKKTGIDLAAAISNFLIPFIFITALSHEDALDKLLSYMPAAYLSKPINKADLCSAMHLALENQKKETDKFIEIQSGRTNHRFALNRIVYVQADHIYCNVILEDRKELIRVPLSKFVEQSHHKLRRINRKTAVNPNFIKSETSTKVTLVNDMTLSVSKKY